MYDLETLREPDTPRPGRRPDPIRLGGPPRADPICPHKTIRPAQPARRPIDRSTAGAGLAESPGTLRLTIQSRLAEPRRREAILAVSGATARRRAAVRKCPPMAIRAHVVGAIFNLSVRARASA